MTATIDAARFAELQATAGADFVVELIDTFLHEAPGMLADIARTLLEILELPHGILLVTGPTGSCLLDRETPRGLVPRPGRARLSFQPAADEEAAVDLRLSRGPGSAFGCPHVRLRCLSGLFPAILTTRAQ